MKIKSAATYSFKGYSQFTSLEEFNTQMEMWMASYKSEFSKGEIIGLKRLVRFAAKVPGVCNAKIGTMLKAIHEEHGLNAISRSTFKRMIQKANSIGIFTVYETERKNGSQSSNLYVFNHFPIQNEPPKQLNHPETSNLSKTKKINTITKRRDDVVTQADVSSEPKESQTKKKLDHTYTGDHVPTEFTKLVKCFYDDAKMIEEYWKMTKIAAYRNNRETDMNCVLEVAIQSFKQMIQKLKKYVVKNPFAYYYGVLNNKFNDVFVEELAGMGFDVEEDIEWEPLYEIVDRITERKTNFL
ncbi:hypothetical protein [Fredinandcohnia sp. 179-A 10B2 NHS]|uniref:hypothetical protein n=1 Tax=Fredinandcohnia sp. 179-A 10B2 NHS TaxID=3235176 RepID=UPI0039A26DC7